MNAVLLPILIPIFFAAFTLFARHSLSRQRLFAGLGSHLTLAAAIYLFVTIYNNGALVLRVGGWDQAFGIVFAADLLGSLMVLFASVTHTLSFWYIRGGSFSGEAEKLVTHPLFLLLSAGVNWAFFTGDMFNLFVSFEIILLCSYVLIVHGGEKPQLREGFKFVVLNLVASALFLSSAGLTYAMFGSLNFAELAIRIQQTENTGAVLAIGTMLMFVFATKAAVFPLYFWLPDSYPKAPIGILPYFGGILTKVGVYCLFRMFTLIFEVGFDEWFKPVLLAIGAATMFLGVMGAVGQWTIRRILSVHIISQIGYMIFALGLMTPLAIAAGIFYVLHNMVVKSSLFMIAGVVAVQEGTDKLKEVKGLLVRSPFLALLFVFAAFSLAGIPPLSGFYGKFALAYEGIREGYGFYVGVSIVTGLFTLFSMTKIWNYSFWGKNEEAKSSTSTPSPSEPKGLIRATAVLVGATLVLGLGSGFFFSASKKAAESVMNPEIYIRSVLGDRGVFAYQEARAERLSPSLIEEEVADAGN